jgi:hypothetical protein
MDPDQIGLKHAPILRSAIKMRTCQWHPAASQNSIRIPAPRSEYLIRTSVPVGSTHRERGRVRMLLAYNQSNRMGIQLGAVTAPSISARRWTSYVVERYSRIKFKAESDDSHPPFVLSAACASPKHNGVLWKAK